MVNLLETIVVVVAMLVMLLVWVLTSLAPLAILGVAIYLIVKHHRKHSGARTEPVQKQCDHCGSTVDHLQECPNCGAPIA